MQRLNQSSSHKDVRKKKLEKPHLRPEHTLACKNHLETPLPTLFSDEDKLKITQELSQNIVNNVVPEIMLQIKKNLLEKKMKIYTEPCSYSHEQKERMEKLKQESFAMETIINELGEKLEKKSHTLTAYEQKLISSQEELISLQNKIRELQRMPKPGTVKTRPKTVKPPLKRVTPRLSGVSRGLLSRPRSGHGEKPKR